MGDRRDSGREAALVILVPEVEGLVGRFRLEHDPSAAAGVPAHVTINYPFVPAMRGDDGLDSKLMTLFASVSPFPYSIQRIARLANLLYLAPEPAEPFHRLIDLVAGRFPESLPYGGLHRQVIPHLTVAESEDEEVLASVEAELGPLLEPRFPIACRADDVWLIDNSGGSWQHRVVFPLGLV